MKYSVIFAVLISCVWSQEAKPTEVAFDGEKFPSEIAERQIPADVLRDFPGNCFASTLCRIFEVGETWPLSPFCGNSTCILGENGLLVEKVNDCGPIPKASEKCKIINMDDRELPYPDCCPTYQCAKGVTLEFPTPEEIAAALETQAKTEAPTEAPAAV